MSKLLVAFLILVPSVALADKDFVDASEGTKWDCASDPVVNISYDAGAFTLTGACTDVNLNGSSVKLTIADAATININGAKNTIAVTAVGAININGVSNKVTWKTAKSGKKPVVATNGKGNAITKVK